MTVTLPPATSSSVAWPSSWGPAPRFATPRTPDRATFGPAVARIAELMGRPLFPWQRYVADVALEVLPSGDWAYPDVLVTAPRRSGKTALSTPTVVHRCGQPGRKSGVWLTAQTLKKAVARWEEIIDLILATPISRQVRDYRGNPQQLLWPATRSTFRPFAPNEQGMHGEDPDLVFVDELQAFNLEQRRQIRAGYRPAWSVKSGQEWQMSTAGTAASQWLNARRRQGRDDVAAGLTRRRATFEWSVPEEVDGTPIAELDPERILELVLDAHPRRDHGLRHGFLEDELEGELGEGGGGLAEFLRAYGNITQTGERPGAFTRRQLEAAQSGARIPADARISLGVAVDEDLREAAIGVAYRDRSETAITDDRRADGTRWVAGEVIRLVAEHDVATVAVVMAGPGRDVADQLKRAGVHVTPVTQSDRAAATVRFSEQLTQPIPGAVHNGAGSFVDAVAAAELGKANAGKVWLSRTGAPITALEARTLAVWGCDHAPEPERPAPAFKVW